MPAPDVALVSLYPVPDSADAGSSGVASYTANLARALAGEGARVTVVAQFEAGQPGVTECDGVRIERKFRRGATALPAAGRAAVATGAPVVHLQHEVFLYGGLSSLAGLAPTLQGWRMKNVGPVVTMHQVVETKTIDRAFTDLHGVSAPAPIARAGIACVQETVRRLAARTIVHEESFSAVVPGAIVLPHGVGAASRSPGEKSEARRRLGLVDDRFVVLCFGFVAPYKGLEVALQAGALLGPAVEMVVAGGEHPRMAGDGYLARLRSEWGHTARFTGYVPETAVSDWFTAADLVLLPYPQPFSSSGVLALAIQHGVPVLLSDVLATCTGADPLLGVRPDPQAIAARIEILATTGPELDGQRNLTSAIGRERSWPAVARRHLELYCEVIDGHAAVAG